MFKIICKKYSFRTSIYNKDIENIYQSIPASLTTYNKKLDSYNYGESDISVTSEIYEEIVDNIHTTKSKINTSNVYEDIDQILCSIQVTPPPLPPRQKQRPEQINKIRYD